MVWPLILFFQFYKIRLTISASQLSLPQITNYKESSHPRGRANGTAVLQTIRLSSSINILLVLDGLYLTSAPPNLNLNFCDSGHEL